MAKVIEETVVSQTGNKSVAASSVKTEVSPTQTVTYLIYFILGAMEILLAFRLVFKITGANPSSGFVNLIYALTQLFVLPFAGIFPRATTEGAVTTAVLEPSTLVAMVVYAVVAWGIVKLVQVLSREQPTE